MEQVADHIFRLGTRAHNFYIVVDGDQATLVDLGCSREWRKLAAGVGELGLGLGSIAGALVTHAHGDHIGLGARAQAEGIDVKVHRADETRALGRYQGKASASASDMPLHRLATWMSTVPLLIQGVLRWERMDSVSTVDHGDSLDLPGHPVVVHTPGHTEGHAMFHCPDLGAVFTGDGLATMDLVGKRTGPQLMDDIFNNDTSQAFDSLDRLGDLEASLLLPGHGHPLKASPAEAVEAARRAQTG